MFYGLDFSNNSAILHDLRIGRFISFLNYDIFAILRK